jgi:hypothetical protein
MFSALNKFQQESLFLVFVIILIFFLPENIYAIWRITQENDAIIHNRMKVSPITNVS